MQFMVKSCPCALTGVQKIDFEKIEKAKQFFCILNEATINNSRRARNYLKNSEHN